MRDRSILKVMCSSQGYGLRKYVRCSLSSRPTGSAGGVYPHVSANEHYCYPRLPQAPMPPAAIWKKRKKEEKSLQRAYYPHKDLVGRVVLKEKTQLVATKIRTSLVIVYAIAALNLEPWILSPSCRSSDATTASKDYILWTNIGRARPDSHSLLVFRATYLPTEADTELLRCIPL